MSNELEALERILWTECLTFHVDDSVTVIDHVEESDVNIVKQALKRNEPMMVKVIFDEDDFYEKYCLCPNCDSNIENGMIGYVSQQYCPRCGKKLDWSE